MSSEKFCLRWNDFEGNISSAFRELREDKDFFDVTLACADEQIQAHRVILSACSPFFRNVLKRNPHQHPLLYLKGVTYNDLQSVLNFMYHGEVNVAQEELNSFLAVAEDLKVKGLTQTQTGSQSGKQELTSKPKEREGMPPPKLKRPGNSLPRNQSQITSTQQEYDIQEIVQQQPVKSEPRDTSMIYSTDQTQVPIPVSAPAEDYSLATYQEEELGYEDYSQYQEGQQIVVGDNGEQMTQYDKGPNLMPEDLNQYVEFVPETKDYFCNICQKFQSKRPSKVKDHLEAIHFPGYFVYFCNMCEKTFTGKNAFAVHNSVKHPKN